jgi:hypothetical protein
MMNKKQASNDNAQEMTVATAATGNAKMLFVPCKSDVFHIRPPPPHW